MKRNKMIGVLVLFFDNKEGLTVSLKKSKLDTCGCFQNERPHWGTSSFVLEMLRCEVNR